MSAVYWGRGSVGSKEDGRRISLVLLETGRRIDGASLRAQAYRDYFYGNDAIIENSFADSEARIAHLLDASHPERLEQIGFEDFYQLRLFLHYQRHRTQRAANEVLAAETAMMRDLVQSWAQVNNIEGVDPHEYSMTHDRPQYLALEQAMYSTPMLLDLEVKMLIRDRPPWFVISDHPVVMYNQFVEHHAHLPHFRGKGGLASRGLQIFMPVSPMTCLVMYDPGVYRCGSKAKRHCHASRPDVERLNVLQALNAGTCIYFRCEHLDEAAIAALRSTRDALADQQAHRVQSGELYTKPDGTQAQLIIYHPPHFAINAKFSFATIYDKTDYQGYPYPFPPVRSERLIELTERYRKEIDRRHDKRADGGADAPTPATETKSTR